MAPNPENPNLKIIRAEDQELGEESENPQSFAHDQTLLDFRLRAQRLSAVQPSDNIGQDFENYFKASGKEAYLPYMAQMQDKRDFSQSLMMIRSGLSNALSNPELHSQYSAETISAERSAIERLVKSQYPSGNPEMFYRARNHSLSMNERTLNVDVLKNPNYESTVMYLTSALQKLQQYAETVVTMEARVDAAFFEIRDIEAMAIEEGVAGTIPRFQEIRSSWLAMYNQVKQQLAAEVVRSELQRSKFVREMNSLSDSSKTSPRLAEMAQQIDQDVDRHISQSVPNFERIASNFEGRRNLLVSSIG